MSDPEWLRKAIAEGSAVVKGVNPSAFGPVLDRAPVSERQIGGMSELFRQQCLRPHLSEKIFQQCIIEFAQALGWMAAHFRSVRVQRKDGTTYYQTPVEADGAGFMDLELVRERLVKAEVKRAGGRLTKEQPKWFNAYVEAGVECYIWYPKDCEQIIEVLTCRRPTTK